jgi:hypothetical protein
MAGGHDTAVRTHLQTARGGRRLKNFVQRWLVQAPCACTSHLDRLVMTSYHHALTLGLFAVLLLWIGWRERANNNARDGWLLFFFGAVALLAAVAVASLT